MEERPFRAASSDRKEGALAPEERMNRLIDSIFSLGGLLVPICAILVGGAISIIAMVHRHNERLAKIERGIDPDSPWPQPK